MNKGFKLYIVAWAALLALFNVIAFVSVGWEGYDKYTGAFWSGYAFITLELIGQLVCAYFAFKGDTLQRKFYNLSLIKINITGLVTSFIVGGLCMLISPLPYFVAIIVCGIVLVLNAISTARAHAGVAIVTKVDEKIKNATFPIKSLTLDAERIVLKANSDFAKAECGKVYDALRYSDPMSHEMLATSDAEIADCLVKLSAAVDSGVEADIATAVNTALNAISFRNSKCRLFK